MYDKVEREDRLGYNKRKKGVTVMCVLKDIYKEEFGEGVVKRMKWGYGGFEGEKWGGVMFEEDWGGVRLKEGMGGMRECLYERVGKD